MSDKNCPINSYGGQAVVEGVMMRGKKSFAVVCRKQNGETVSTCENIENKYPLLTALMKIPFLRGIAALIDSMILGTKTLMYSADIAIADEEHIKETKTEKEKKEVERAKEELKKSNNKVNGIFVGVTAFLGMAIGICLFMLIPIVLTNFASKYLKDFSDNWFIFSLIEGIFKFLIFVGYVFFISLMPDVKRIFKYHGAEHKTINCYEDNQELTVENVQKYTTINPRCGTSFLLIFISVSIILFCLVPSPAFFGKFGILIRFGCKIILMPIIAGIAYECIKFSGKHKNSVFTRVFMKPGLLLQKITTSEPDDQMVECAIKSLQLVIKQEENAKN